MSYDWQQPQPYPTSAFSQIANGIGALTQWLPFFQQQHREKMNAARDRLAMMAQLYGPNWAQQYPDVYRSVASDIENASRPFHLFGPQKPPTMPFPRVPTYTTQTAPGTAGGGGANVEAPSTTTVTPPTSGAFGPATATIPNVPTGRQEIALPRQSGMNRMVSSFGPTSPVYRAVVNAGLDPADTTMADAMKIPGVDVLVARSVEFPETQPTGTGGADGAPTGAGGVPVPGRSTFGDFFPDLATSPDPRQQRMAGMVIPNSYYDLRTGTLDSAKLNSFIDRQFGSPFQQTQADTRASTARYSQFRENLKLLTDQARAVLDKDYASTSEAGIAQRRAHDLYVQARQAVAAAVRDGTITSDQGSQILSALPQSFTPGVRPQRPVHVSVATEGRVPENVRVAIQSLQGQLNTLPPGPARDAIQKRLQAIYDKYDIPADAGETRTSQQYPAARNAAEAKAKVDGLWSAAGVYPQPVRAAMYRIVHNQAQPGDQQLLQGTPIIGSTSALDLVSGILQYNGQLQSWQSGQPGAQPGTPSPQTPSPQQPTPQGAKPGVGRQIRMADLQRKAAQTRTPIAKLVQEAKDQGYTIVP